MTCDRFRSLTYVCILILNMPIAKLFPTNSQDGFDKDDNSESHNRPNVKYSLISGYHNGMWNDLTSALNYGWNNVISFSGAVTNKSMYDAYKKQTSDRGTSSEPPPADLAVTENEFNCDDATCIAWKTLNVVGVSLGAGFLISLLIPIICYGACLSLGLLWKAISWTGNLCRRKPNIPIGDYQNVFNRIATASLDSMFAVGPIFVLWMCATCMIGWMLWPLF